MRYAAFVGAAVVCACGARAQLDTPADDGGPLPSCDPPMATHTCTILTNMGTTVLGHLNGFPVGLVSGRGKLEMLLSSLGPAPYSIVPLSVVGGSVSAGDPVALGGELGGTCSFVAEDATLARACAANGKVSVFFYDATNDLVGQATFATSSTVPGNVGIARHGSQWLVSWSDAANENRFALLDDSGHTLAGPTKLFDKGSPSVGDDGCGWVASTEWNDPQPTAAFDLFGYVQFGGFGSWSKPINVENGASAWPGEISITRWPYDVRTATIYIDGVQPSGSASLFALDDRGISRKIPLAQAPSGYGDLGGAWVLPTSFGLVVMRGFPGGTNASPQYLFDATVISADASIVAESSWDATPFVGEGGGIAALDDTVVIVTADSTTNATIKATVLTCHN